MLKLWFTVHIIALVTQFALTIASFATFVTTGFDNVAAGPRAGHEGFGRVLAPWASFGVSGFAVAINFTIIPLVYKLQLQDPSSTEESRALHRRLVLGGSALFALLFAVVDMVFSVLFAKGRQNVASCVAGVAALSAFSALVVDVGKIYDDHCQNRSIRLEEEEQSQPLGSISADEVEV